MPALQNCGVKDPDTKSANHLQARERSPRKKTANQSKRIKREAEPKQPRDRSKKIGQGRQMIKNGMQLMGLELALLDEIHYPGNAGEPEGAISDERNRGVKFQPGIWRQFDRVPHINRRDQGKSLNQENERRGERPHEGEPVSRPDQHIDERNRPGEEDQNLKQVRQRASTKCMTTDGQECRLKNEPKSDRKKTKPARLKSPRADRKNRPHNCGEKTKRRDDEKLLIHQKQNSKITTSAWQSGVCLHIRNELPKTVLHL